MQSEKIMRVKMKSTMCGPGGNFNAGQIAEFDDEQAQALIDGGYAEVIDRPRVFETAALATPETAVTPSQKQAKRGRNAA